jgi:hypothetical protein
VLLLIVSKYDFVWGACNQVLTAIAYLFKQGNEERGTVERLVIISATAKAEAVQNPRSPQKS